MHQRAQAPAQAPAEVLSHETIFVSIASYRDPELGPTVRDCLARARRPDRLRFGICWQHGDDEPLPSPLDDLARFTVLDIPWQRSMGACWARAVIMDLWAGEDWYLQLDSHHRFVQDWDVRLIEQAALTRAEKPVLTTYPTPYFPDEPAEVPADATQIDFMRFDEEGCLVAVPAPIEDPTGAPRRARFVGAGFLFAPGRFVDDVPYDPDLYFTGEETTLALRAFTHGYDLFHPGVPIAAHEYTRAQKVKHWVDHHDTRIDWRHRDALGRQRLASLLAEPSVGHYGLGPERTLTDYERYAGVDFARREVTEAVLRGDEPEPFAAAV